jgi:hypothetical protein
MGSEIDRKMKSIKITDAVEIPIPEFVKTGSWHVDAEWKNNCLTKLEFKKVE